MRIVPAAGGAACRRSRPARPPAPAFTLIEVMVALMVLTFAILVFATSLPVSRQAARVNSQYVQATNLCQHKIDQLRQRGYGGLTYANLSSNEVIDTAVATQPYSFTGRDKVADLLPNATTEVTIDDLSDASKVSDSERPSVTGPATLSGETRRVTVTVRWKKSTFENKPSSMSLVALIVKQ